MAQLLVAPAFLAPIYYHVPDRSHPYAALLAYLIAPVTYVGLFASRNLLHAAARGPAWRRSTVFRAILSGTFYGTIFGALVVTSLGVVLIFDQRSTPPKYPLLFLALHAVVLGGFILLHYCLIGAATGGLVGLVVDLLQKPRTSDGTIA